MPVLLCAALVAQAADLVAVQASRQGDAVEVQAQALVTAPQALIWKTLTDYDRLAEFVPGISKSHLLSRSGGVSTVEQTGTARLWFFTYPIDVVVESTERPPHAIDMRLLRGNLRRLDGGYRIEKVDAREGTYWLKWSGVIEPSAPIPLAMAVPLMRANIAEQFTGMVREIERREALRAQGKAGQAPSMVE